MKLEKILAGLFVIAALSGCATTNSKIRIPEIDARIADELWHETLRITGSKPDLKMPEFKFEYVFENGNALAEVVDSYTIDKPAEYVLTSSGVYVNGIKQQPRETIIFYMVLITKGLKELKLKEQYKFNRWQTEEIDKAYTMKIYLLYILAHELLHPAIPDKNNDHRMMLEKRYLERLINFINEKNGVPKNNSLEKEEYSSLQWQIDQEESR